MVWWIQVLEIADNKGKGVGKWRLTAKSDEDGGSPYGLCSHKHDTPQEAQQCLIAQQEAKRYG